MLFFLRYSLTAFTLVEWYAAYDVCNVHLAIKQCQAMRGNKAKFNNKGDKN